VFVTSRRLAGHFSAAANQLADIKLSKRANTTEKQLTEILRDTYEIEELSLYTKGREDGTLPKPRILFGKNTSA